MASVLVDHIHDRCQKRHRWRRFVRHDGLSMVIEICEASGETAKSVGDYFEKFFGWTSTPVKRV